MLTKRKAPGSRLFRCDDPSAGYSDVEGNEKLERSWRPRYRPGLFAGRTAAGERRSGSNDRTVGYEHGKADRHLHRAPGPRKLPRLLAGWKDAGQRRTGWCGEALGRSALTGLRPCDESPCHMAASGTISG